MRARLLSALLLAGLAASAPASSAAVDEGRPEALRWGRLALVSETPFDTTAWFETRALEGRPVDEAPLEPALLAGLRDMAARGYAFAQVVPRNFDVDGDRLHGVLDIDPGPRARVETLRLTGATVTRQSTALRLAGLEPGDPYTGLEHARVRERLARSGLFTQVKTPEVRPGSDSLGIVLEVPVVEPPYTRFAGLLGAGGRDGGVTGFLDLDLRNLAGTAREAAGRWESRGDGLSRFRLRYREPWLPLIPIGLEGSLRHDVKELLYSYTVWEIKGDLEIINGWRVGLGRGGSRAVETGKGKVDEGFFTAFVELDRRDSALLPTDGFRLAVQSRRGEKEERPSADSLSVRVNRMHWDAQAEGYERFGRQWMGALRARFQFLDSPEDSLPRWDLIPVGGATSLRGYREEQFLTAGALTLQAEWQWLHGGAGSALYVFGDTGLLRRETAGRARWDEFLLGTGLGIRQQSRVGVLGLEYGIAVSEGPLDGRIHLRLDAAF